MDEQDECIHLMTPSTDGGGGKQHAVGFEALDAVDVLAGQVTELIDDARRALDRVTAIKRGHTQAKRSIDQAGSQVVSLVSEVEQVLDALQDELTTPGSSQ